MNGIVTGQEVTNEKITLLKYPQTMTCKTHSTQRPKGLMTSKLIKTGERLQAFTHMGALGCQLDLAACFLSLES